MLGLGNTIVTSNPSNIVWSIQSDFTSSSGQPWIALGSSLTLAYGENAPAQSTGDWLKITYGATQTGASGIRITNVTDTFLGGIQPGTGLSVEASAQFYLVDDSGKWDPEGDSDAVNFRVQGGGQADHLAVALDQVVNWTASISSTTSNLGALNIEVWTPDDRPQSGAVGYIRDLKVTITK